MRRLGALGVVFGLGCLMAALRAQTPPDFSGRWTTAPDPATVETTAFGQRGRRGGGRGPQSGDMGSGWGDVIAITQNGSTLEVEYAFFSRGDLQPPLRYTYALDGSTATNTVTMGRGEQAQQSRTRWDGRTLVVTTTYTFAHPGTGRPVEGTETRTLTLQTPATLMVEVTRAGVLGGPASTTRTAYRHLDPR